MLKLALRTNSLLMGQLPLILSKTENQNQNHMIINLIIVSCELVRVKSELE